MLEDPHQAIEWLMQLTSVTPTDAQVLAKLGDLYDNEGDKSQAFQYYYEVKKKRPLQNITCSLLISHISNDVCMICAGLEVPLKNKNKESMMICFISYFIFIFYKLMFLIRKFNSCFKM